MDFGLSDEQHALVGLMRRILEDRCTLARLTEVEAGRERFDRELWAELAAADLLGLTLPEASGGGGFGFLELCLLLHEQGRAVAPLPLAPTLLGAMAIARFGAGAGAGAAQAALVSGVAAGDTVLTIALDEPTGDPQRPTVTARPVDGGWVLSGAKTGVPAFDPASALLASARIEDGPADDRITGVFVVDADAPGLRAERQDTFNHEPQHRLDVDDVAVPSGALLSASAPGVVLPWLVDRATVALCAVAAGVAERGLRLTADYSIERKQFDRQIATFQAVGQRLADGFIDAEAVRLTMLQAASRLDRDEPAAEEVAVAKYWASAAGSRVGHTGLHVHGGISIDLDYPIHRYFLWAKQLELTLGAGSEQLGRLGDLLARDS